MKKNVMKTMVAAVCVVAAGMGGFKAYSFANQSETSMLLSENVEALSCADGVQFDESSHCKPNLFHTCYYSYGCKKHPQHGTKWFHKYE